SGKRVADIASHHATYGTVVDPKTGETVDEALLLLMYAPHSYTKEDVAEIQCHGGIVSIRKILLLTYAYGARPAEAGEFTKRAFLNGRLDLTQAEAVIDVIRAKTDASQQMAISQLTGKLSAKIGQLRHDLLRQIAALEAAIDFPEEDIEETAVEETREVAQNTIREIDTLLKGASVGRILKDGLKTVIVGKPNVGKSSLMNALSESDRAIVTNVPGTTRDVIEEYINLGGIPLRIVDTAGIRETDDIVEKIGVEKSQEWIEQADLILFLLDVSREISEEDEDIFRLIEGKKALIILNKSDLEAKLDRAEIEARATGHKILTIAAQTGDGLDELKEAITELVYEGTVKQEESVLLTNTRQIHLLEKAARSLRGAEDTISAAMPADCIVIDLRGAWETLGEVTGDAVGDDIIDQIFTQFCIGK
ncbi:MAG: tRNA uridine-5-carboxymethylaminomethyl(34) synthesis GTPase MnmE, partial [Selenomonadales bacterium]|nr:tRNA uridine-5-carboxymethylaminomethyl(34) synthesis GTPase MnmE [Selenomonadales bacterium]